MSSNSVQNKSQVGIWYTAPCLFLKISDNIAKIYKCLNSNEIIATTLKYNSTYPGGIFTSSKFSKYKNRMIKFNYNSELDKMKIDFYDNRKQQNIELPMIKLSDYLYKKIIYKMKLANTYSTSSIDLLLQILND